MVAGRSEAPGSSSRDETKWPAISSAAIDAASTTKASTKPGSEERFKEISAAYRSLTKKLVR